jgi:hypothetical protein
MTRRWGGGASSGAGDSTRYSGGCSQGARDGQRDYLDFHDDAEINWVMIRAVQASVAGIGDCADAGCAGTGQRGADESSRQDERELESGGIKQRRVALVS